MSPLKINYRETVTRSDLKLSEQFINICTSEPPSPLKIEVPLENLNDVDQLASMKEKKTKFLCWEFNFKKKLKNICGWGRECGPTLFGLLLPPARIFRWGSDLAGQEHTSTSGLLFGSDENASESRPIWLKLSLNLLQRRPSRRGQTQRPIAVVPDPVLDHWVRLSPLLLKSSVGLRLSKYRRDLLLQNLLLSQSLKL